MSSENTCEDSNTMQPKYAAYSVYQDTPLVS